MATWGFTPLNEVRTRSSSFLKDTASGGSFSLAVTARRRRDRQKGLDGRPVNYFVYELSATLPPSPEAPPRPARTFTPLGPAIVKGSFVDGMDGRSYTGRRLVALAPAASVEVREVPLPRPATFCGGIGDYRLAASANPTALRVGDPLTLTLDVKRGLASGSLDLISAPDLTANPQIAADFLEGILVDKSPPGKCSRDGEVVGAVLSTCPWRPKGPDGGFPWPLVWWWWWW